MPKLRDASAEAHRTAGEASIDEDDRLPAGSILDQMLVARVAGVADPQTVGRWARGAAHAAQRRRA